MLNYQLNPRFILYEKKGESISLPNFIEITLELSPPEVFGKGEKPSRTMAVGSAAKIICDMLSGKTGAISDPPLKPVEFKLRTSDGKFEFCQDGNVITAKQFCEAPQDVGDFFNTFYFALPIVYNLNFSDPIAITSFKGKCGEVKFGWVMHGLPGTIDSTTTELQEEKILKSYNTMEILQGDSNRRLFAGIHYFHVARRLVNAGNTAVEFTAEIILNYSKSLEVMFGSSRDDIRVELRKLGINECEIENVFIPVTLIRNEFDVGHALATQISEEDIYPLNIYVSHLEGEFRSLFQIIIEKIRSGHYEMVPHHKSKLDDDKQKKLDKIIENLLKKEGNNPSNFTNQEKVIGKFLKASTNTTPTKDEDG